MRALAEELGVIYFDRLDNKGAKVGNLNVKGTVVSIRHSCNPKLPSVYTVKILDFAGQKDEYIRNLWTNLGWRIFRA